MLPRVGGVTGWAALHWLGGRWLDGVAADGVTHLDVPLAHDGLRITSAEHAVTFEMRYAADPVSAVEALDMACFNDVVSLAELAAYLPTLGPLTGIQQARDALAQAEENSWSPRETRMPLVWTRRAGIVRPLCNVPVSTLDGRFVGTPDLFDPVAGLAGDYDGALHLAGAQRAKDIGREGELRDVGLEYLPMVDPHSDCTSGLPRTWPGCHRPISDSPSAARRRTLGAAAFEPSSAASFRKNGRPEPGVGPVEPDGWARHSLEMERSRLGRGKRGGTAVPGSSSW